MNYISLHFYNMRTDDAEIASSHLLAYGFEGTETHDEGFTAFINEPDYTKDNIDSYLSTWQEIWHCLIDKQLIPQTNWNAEWEKNFSPILISNSVFVRAPFHPKVEAAQYEIVIEPKMSFGTGHHATTHMMLEWLLETDLTDKHVLDIGTGTGILSILAEKRGAYSITATDNDEWSINNALENTALNGCHAISVVHADGFNPSVDGYDIILANIQRSYFEAHVSQLCALLKQGGKLFISGYLNSDINTINSLLQQNTLVLKGIKEREGWVSESYQSI